MASIGRPPDARLEFSLLKPNQPGFDLRSKRQAGPGICLLQSSPSLQITQLSLLAVQSTINPCINESTDHPAASHSQHAVERHCGVKGADTKRGMQENEQRTANTQHHMHQEPPLDTPPISRKTEMLAQGVAKQEQHHDATGHPDPVTHVVACLEKLHPAKLPRSQYQADNCQIDNDIDGHRTGKRTVLVQLLHRRSACTHEGRIRELGVPDGHGVRKEFFSGGVHLRTRNGALGWFHLMVIRLS